MKILAAVRTGSILASISVLPAAAQTTERVSVAGDRSEGNGNTGIATISADGRFVAFYSLASNLVPGDTNGRVDSFVRDRILGTTERVSVDSAEAEANADSYNASISGDGRYVAFYSFATNLVAGDTNGVHDVFVRDRQLGTTVRASVDSAEVQANSDSVLPVISADGRYVAFYSMAGNLVPTDTNGVYDVFLRDLQLGTTEILSVGLGGVQGNGPSTNPAISSDGRYVAFTSSASNFVPSDGNGVDDIFLRDRMTGTTARVSVGPGGTQATGGCDQASISGDASYVAFWSTASNLVAGDTNGTRDIFVRDRNMGTTERVSVSSAGAQANFGGEIPSISADGRYVGFSSAATDLVPGDTNGQMDVFVRDRLAFTTERVSLSGAGVQGNFGSDWPSLSADGRFVAFVSWASNLVPSDFNGVPDDFVRDRDATSFTSLCSPGVGGVIACPCSNPPSGQGRGCNNSSATGGAILSASGVAYLSSDTLVFTTSGEKPSALSIVTQWTGTSATGIVFGMGVRCAAGNFKRLYSKGAVGGSITAPSGGDPAVSVRAAALGDPILAGQSRWYLVHYRDQMVLGGCPLTSNFNATQTGRVVWSL